MNETICNPKEPVLLLLYRRGKGQSLQLQAAWGQGGGVCGGTSLSAGAAVCKTVSALRGDAVIWNTTCEDGALVYLLMQWLFGAPVIFTLEPLTSLSLL